MSGIVYVIESGEFLKIGKTSKSAFGRLRDLQTGSPHPLSLLCYIETDKHTELERELHRCFQKERVRGEWFKLKPEHVARIQEMADWNRPLTREERQAQFDEWYDAELGRRRELVSSVRCQLTASASQRIAWNKSPITFGIRNELP